MQQLNLPTYKFRFKSSENKLFIFDIIRKKYVVLTPEEWVRQHFVWFLIEEKKYPISLFAVEKKLTINKLTRRTDILIFNAEGNPDIIVECKAPSIKITQETFDQIARYNLKLNANYLITTNGLEHFYCNMDFKNERYIFLKDIPNYSKFDS
ncbi:MULTISPECIES: type I restriction enzyme HsdR N-terminal domain-containing protein [Flavobacteriaceae]|uniref:Type I restriction enzyme HsdR N-terminal domain-containing protein n=2 Tax=Flavobacteriaceae TaxID=49546 RepID=A0A4Y8AYG1_9FLAO|nr:MULTISPECIES: type I restriction enzyme HsdR N-terminal domain-containing protein [Flavobacteriaceae]TEW76932.1 type I restriction enzyme HsdR N-terminal domain-containing protein [Gramella jeungdoensis]GGK59207.1 restriction endonuclease subunit R [Lutibacter litoralis]